MENKKQAKLDLYLVQPLLHLKNCLCLEQKVLEWLSFFYYIVLFTKFHNDIKSKAPLKFKGQVQLFLMEKQPMEKSLITNYDELSRTKY